jgi:hypothetical protein
MRPSRLRWLWLVTANTLAGIAGVYFVATSAAAMLQLVG